MKVVFASSWKPDPHLCFGERCRSNLRKIFLAGTFLLCAHEDFVRLDLSLSYGMYANAHCLRSYVKKENSLFSHSWSRNAFFMAIKSKKFDCFSCIVWTSDGALFPRRSLYRLFVWQMKVTSRTSSRAEKKSSFRSGSPNYSRAIHHSRVLTHVSSTQP